MGYSNMMQWSLNENNPTKAIEYGRESINYLKKFPIKQLEMRVDSLMYAALKKIKRNDEALQYLESFTKKKKRIVSSENTKNLNANGSDLIGESLSQFGQKIKGIFDNLF